MIRYTETFRCEIYENIFERSLRARIAGELAMAPYERLRMDRDAGYVAYALECMHSPNHIANLQRDMQQVGSGEAPLGRRNGSGDSASPLGRDQAASYSFRQHARPSSYSEHRLALSFGAPRGRAALEGPKSLAAAGSSIAGASAAAGGNPVTGTSAAVAGSSTAGASAGSHRWQAPPLALTCALAAENEKHAEVAEVETEEAEEAGCSLSVRPQPLKPVSALSYPRHTATPTDTQVGEQTSREYLADRTRRRQGTSSVPIGPTFQVSSLPEVGPVWAAPPTSADGKPRCRCGELAVWRFKRWWCAATTDDSEVGCGFEYVPPPRPQQPSPQQPSPQPPIFRRKRSRPRPRHVTSLSAAARGGSGGDADGICAGKASQPSSVELSRAQPSSAEPQKAPLCLCRRIASWSKAGYWHCDASRCSFVHHGVQPDAERSVRPEPHPISPADFGRPEVWDGTAAMLTASAYAPVEPFCFVSPRGDCGLGLFARVPLRPGQFVAEYGGPRLPARVQVVGE